MMEIPVEREARPVTSLHAPMSHLQLPRRLVWLLIIVCGCAQEDAPPEQARPPPSLPTYVRHGARKELE